MSDDDLRDDLTELLTEWAWAAEYVEQDTNLEGDYADGLRRAVDDLHAVLTDGNAGPKPCGDQHPLPCGLDERCPVPGEYADADKTDLEVVTDWEDSDG